jgi:hypothetical protein
MGSKHNCTRQHQPLGKDALSPRRNAPPHRHAKLPTSAHIDKVELGSTTVVAAGRRAM